MKLDIYNNTYTPRQTIALCGNPNSGKTTLFNLLTGSNQKVGNWPGVTVERKTGVYKKDTAVSIVDTPGVYSLTPFTPDEQITRSFLEQNKPNVIINVVDSTNLERNLFLTSQLLELNAPVVVALNMQDEARAKGIYVDTKILEQQFGCKFFEISAAKNIGIDKLMEYCLSGNYEHAKSNLQIPTLPSAEQAEIRYNRIEKIVKQAQRTEISNKAQQAYNTTERIDKIALNKWLAFPIFALIMTVIFYISVGSVGGWLTALINDLLTPALQTLAANWLSQTNTPWLTSLVCEGIIGGVMSVVGFVPQIMLLFGCIAILEASGYMSRIAFITDRMLSKIGLGGRSFVSMILGCGCSVPAIVSTRAIKSEKERNATITLTPFMPCSAKLAVIAFFTSYLLGGNALFAISFYFVSILAVIGGGLVLKLLRRSKEDARDLFVMELPTYRLPTAQNIAKQMWERGKAFLMKAGTVILLSSVVLWLLTHFGFDFHFADTEHSMLASIGKFIHPIFIPLGFNDGGYGWQYSVAALSGIAAKETVVTTLNILLPQGIRGTISGLGAYSFVTYNLLTIPCVAAISASFAEQGNWRTGLKSMLFQIFIAYTVSLLIYQAGRLAQKYTAVFYASITVTIIAVCLFFATRHVLCNRSCCKTCNGCPRNKGC